MPRSRALAVASAIAAVSLGTLLIASPAQAATLPAGQKITVIDDYYGQVYNADPVTAALTFVGDGFLLSETQYLTATDVNDDGIGYAVMIDFNDEEDWGASYLLNVDANTGTVSNPVDITIPAHQSIARGCQALDLAPDGTLWTACFEANGNDTYLTVVGTLEASTGVLTPLLTIQNEVLFTAIASNPVTGQLWMFDWDVSGFGDSLLWDFEESEPGKVADIGNPVWAADFDRDGQLFVSTWEFVGEGDPRPQLQVLDPNTGQFSDGHYFTIEGNNMDSEQQPPLTVWGKEVLPATGPVDVLPYGLGAVLLLVAGGAFVALQRRRAEA